MFEELKNIKKIKTPLLIALNADFCDLYHLNKLEILDINELKRFLVIKLEKNIDNSKQKYLIDLLLLDDLFLLEQLKKNCDKKENEEFNSTFYIIVHWLVKNNYVDVLRGFDLVEVFHDLLIYFDNPDLEKKYFNYSFSDFELIEKNISIYLNNIETLSQ